MFAWIKSKLENNPKTTERIAWITIAISLTMLAVFAVLAVLRADSTLVISAGLGAFTSLLIFGVGLLLTPEPRDTHKPPYEQREDALVVLQRIIEAAGSSKRAELCVMAVAGSDFLSKEAPVKRCFIDAVERRKIHVRFILLDPKSAAAQIRAECEKGRVDTIRMINTCVEFLKCLAEQHANVDYALHSQYACFLCFNHQTMVYQPYFASATGNLVPLLEAHVGTDSYRIGKEHFEAIWKYERK